MPRIVGFAGGAFLNVNQDGPPVIVTTSLSGAAVGVAYSRTLVATGTGPITWTVTVGTLPTGLSLDSGTGVISGTPTTEETQAFTVQASNAFGSDTQALSITVALELPSGIFESTGAFGGPPHMFDPSGAFGASGAFG